MKKDKPNYETKVIVPDTQAMEPDTTLRHDGKPKEGGFPPRCPEPEEKPKDDD
jgi:hypothetical protein